MVTVSNPFGKTGKAEGLALSLELVGLTPEEYFNLYPLERQLISEVAAKLEQERWNRRAEIFKKLFS